MKPKWIPQRLVWLSALLGLALVILVIGLLDLVTGRAASVTVLYLVPVLAAAWFLGRYAGLAACVCASFAGLSADYILQEDASVQASAQFWNAGAKLVVYATTAWLTSQVRAMLRARDELIAQLDTAAREIKTLCGLLPICAWCKRIRDEDGGDWKPVEHYVAEHSDAEFTHGICPDCAEKVMPGGRLRDSDAG